MLIIYGWGRKTTKDYGPAYMVKCGNCRNDTFYNLVRIRKWFTLFYIPVIPYSSEYYLVCHHCSAIYQPHASGIENAKKLVQITASYLDGKMTKDEYNILLNDPHSASKTYNPDNSWECPKCKGSNKNDSYKCSYCGYNVV
ncbi:MAG TPA: zinc-ribbon domain-containing protein [Clostridia bacterium]